MGVWDLKKVEKAILQGRDLDKREAYNQALWLWEEGMLQSRDHENILNEESEKQLLSWIKRIHEEEPVQYIIGHTWFYGLKLKVTPHVLIPRPETEELVDWILSDYNSSANPLQILDIGTGSGCIAVSLKKQLGSHVNVMALDVSEDALEVARENAKSQKVDITFIRQNFLLTGLEGLGRFDIIVSNPPYIWAGDLNPMEVKGLSFEPSLALFPEDRDPDIFYKLFSEVLPAHLKPEGTVYLELNEFRASGVKDLFIQTGWRSIEVRNDLQGKPRMLKAKNPLI